MDSAEKEIDPVAELAKQIDSENLSIYDAEQLLEHPIFKIPLQTIRELAVSDYLDELDEERARRRVSHS